MDFLSPLSPTMVEEQKQERQAYEDTRFDRLNESSINGLSLKSHESDMYTDDDFRCIEYGIETSTSPATISIASLSLKHQEGKYDDDEQQHLNEESKVVDITLGEKVSLIESSFSCFSPPSVHQDQHLLVQHHKHISGDILMGSPSSQKYLTSDIKIGRQQQPEDSPSSVISIPNISMPARSLKPIAPILYSAINSLENATANSFGTVRSNYKELSGCRGIPPISIASTALAPEEQIADRITLHSNQVITTEPLKPPYTTADKANKPRAVNVILEPPKATIRKASSHGHLMSIGNNVNNQGDRDESRQKKLKDGSLKKSRFGRRRRVKPVELFRPSCDAYTPRIGDGYPKSGKDIKFRPAETRDSLTSSSMGTLSHPNFRDALRRVAMIIRQHIVKIERRFEVNAGTHGKNSGLFKASMMEHYSQYNFCDPTYKCAMVRLPMARPGMIYGLREIQTNYDKIPTEQEIYEFGHRLFQKVQLSSECSIVCLIYMERLMEIAKVPVVARTWRPIFMCGLLLASKVWQDLSSWNIEFASVYPQFSLDQINRLELLFLKNIKWDLYISSSLYAKYYFALRSLLEKRDFRNRYNRMVLGHTSAAENDQALKVQQRSEQIKEKALLQLSRSM